MIQQLAAGLAIVMVTTAAVGANAQVRQPAGAMLLANLESLPMPRLPAVRERASVNAPTRAYAIDGASFYLDGQRVVLSGLERSRPELLTRHAAQRLQRALDQGDLEIESLGRDASGALLARVSVKGRDLIELLR